MNTNTLKKFAQGARIKLLEQVGAKLDYVLNTDTPELRERSGQIRRLREVLTKTTKEQLIDKVSYTWFNRFMALRFMDANDYQPIGIRVLTPKDGYTLPELLDEAKAGHIPEELIIKRQRIFDLLDGKMPSVNGQNEAYKELLIGACNYLSQVFPFLFERINDYTELLLPDDLTSELSIVGDICEGMTTENCAEVEIIGWLYQFYISAKKDEVFASKSAVKKEDIPAATQLFTPRWIVEYMVQNTIGKLWLQNKPNSKLRNYMPYFIDSPAVTAGDYLKISSVEEIKLLDQACGSGHILVYGFELIYKIYEEEGYNPNEIPELIIKHNLYGFEIDERASQLAAMAIMMKARSYNRRFFKKEIDPNILCYKDLTLSVDEAEATLHKIGLELSEELNYDLVNMQQATNYGSLILPHTPGVELEKILFTISKKDSSDAFLKYDLEQLTITVRQLLLLSQKYHCIVDNPPYMGSGGMNRVLGDFVKLNYPDSKADLMACFMEAGLCSLKPKGFLAMINQHTWMFLSSYEKLRKKLIKTTFFDTVLHLGSRTFPEIGGEVVQNTSFIFWNTIIRGVGNYVRLVDLNTTELKQQGVITAVGNETNNLLYKVNQEVFDKIPGSPIAYWVGANTYTSFGELDALSKDFNVKSGVMTGNDYRFLKYWSELDFSSIGFGYSDQKDINHQRFKFFPLNKEEGFRKWAGRFRQVLHLEKEGENFSSVSNLNYRLRDANLYFKVGISWGDVAGGNSSYRFQDEGLIFAARAPMIFTDNINLAAFLNSKVSNYFQGVLNPTLSFNLSDLDRLPISSMATCDLQIEVLTRECLEISNLEWNSNECSWNFKINELIRIKGQDLEETYDLYQYYWKNRFFQLHKNEEDLNRRFIEIYGLHEELIPDVPLEEITILKEETIVQNGRLVFKANEIFKQFLSYAVGCMFGRYSLDKEGLILANYGDSLENYLSKLNKLETELSFLPDDDNIIPVLDDEWFEDDITGRFYTFLKASFGLANFDKNLAFVEECLGKDVRKYFMRDFYADHIKRYKKRPIYWMFSSPKASFNVLVYAHRYTPDTLNKILNSYLIEYREKLDNRIEHLDHLIVSGSSLEQTKSQKEKDRLKLVLIELQEYEREIIRPLAIERINIDLGEGVLINYNKFGNAIKEVVGLNDKATKKKVREFDWINIEEIR